jgi:signal transduction histidine kinase
MKINKTTILVILIFVIGVCLSVWGHIFSKKIIREDAQKAFEIAAEERYATFKDGLNKNIKIIQSLKGFVNASGEISKEAFSVFAATCLEDESSLSALEWIPQVPYGQTEQLKNKLMAEGIDDFWIKEKDKSGEFISAKKRENYYPVLYVEPEKGNEPAIGFDLGAEVMRREALLKARDTGEYTITGRIKLVQGKRDAYAVLAYLPVYKRNASLERVVDRQKYLSGFALGVLKIPELYESSLQFLSPAGIDVYLFDATEKGAPAYLYHHTSRLSQADSNMDNEGVYETLETQKNIIQRRVQVGSRDWLMVFQPRQDFLKKFSNNYPDLVLVLGLLITLTLSIWIYNKLMYTITIENRVNERTQQLNEKVEVIKNQNKDLEDSKKATLNLLEDLQQAKGDLEEREFLLKRSNEELEQFAYVASHDLQEPLRMVASFTQLLEKRYEKKLDKKGKEYISYAVDGSKRMQKLIDNLLQFSRIGRKVNDLEEVDLNKLVDEIKTDFQLRIKETNAKIIYDQLPVLNVNRSQIKHLFQNLISNAIKFCEQPPIINISTQKIGNGWEFKVSDNGIGIAEKYLDKIFVIFQRLHTRKEYEGTGIGLALCKKIVENYGGNISVESELGKGTTFQFIIKKGV